MEKIVIFDPGKFFCFGLVGWRKKKYLTYLSTCIFIIQ